MHFIEVVNAPLWIGIVIGFPVGMIGEVWGLGNPEMFIRLARLTDRLLVGCFLLAIGFGSIVLYSLYWVGIGLHLDPKALNIVAIALGGTMFGAGLAISGYAPGTVFMALGEGRGDSLFALAGGLLGAASWTALYQTAVGGAIYGSLDYGNLVLAGRVVCQADRTCGVRVFSWLNGIGGRWGIVMAAFAYGAVCLVAVRWVKRFKPAQAAGRHRGRQKSGARERRELREMLAEGGLPYESNSIAYWLNHDYAASTNFYSAPMAWSGFAVAVIVVVAIVVRQILGESTTYSWLVGQIWMRRFAYSREVLKSIGWEPFSSLGTFAGALTAALLLTGRFTAFKQVQPRSWRALTGGRAWPRRLGSFGGTFLVLFGARMAGGCTSGHILSGDLQMSLSGLLFTAVVATSMIVTARLLYRDVSSDPIPANRPETRSFARLRHGQGILTWRFLLPVLIIGGNAAMILVAARVTSGAASQPITLSRWLGPASIFLLLLLFATAIVRMDSPSCAGTQQDASAKRG